jgi:nucleotide-binding universal stress UspA family protein
MANRLPCTGMDAAGPQRGYQMSDENPQKQVVVAGVDGSQESIAALDWARRYAEATGATVRAVLAWHFPTAAGQPPEGLAPSPIREQAEENLRGQLSEAVAKVYSGPSAAALETKLSYGHPAQVLIDESAEADLLVVGHRGRGAFTGMLLGSVSVHCVNGAHCPVVVVRGD